MVHKEHRITYSTTDKKVVEIGSLDLGEGTALPVGSVMIETSAYTSITALAYCNMHGVWESSVSL
jgi:desulfoferrodoxin (superoxide reductase-like protein)